MSEREREEIQGVSDEGQRIDPSDGTSSAEGQLPGGGTTKSIDPPTRPPDDDDDD